MDRRPDADARFRAGRRPARLLLERQRLAEAAQVLDGYDDLDPATLKQLRSSYKNSYSFRDKIDIEGLDHPKRMFDLTEGLIRRKYSDAEIRGILGGNFARVLGQIWAGQKTG